MIAETRTAPWPLVLATVSVVVGLCIDTVRADDAVVTIKSDARHQTILGWSATPWYLGVAPEVRDQVLDELTEELGLTWLHWTVPSGNRSNVRSWEWGNYDEDPLHIKWSAFDRVTVKWYMNDHIRIEDIQPARWAHP